MTVINSYQHHVLPNWKAFIGGKNQTSDLRLQILESWVRCQKASVNPYNSVRHSRLEGADLRKMLIDKQELIKVAKPIMNNLYQFVEGSGFVVVLTDEQGYIMEMFGDDDTISKFHDQ